MIGFQNLKVEPLNRLIFFTLIISLSTFKVSYCQSLTESSTASSAIKNALSIYSQSLGEQAGLYNGPEYTGYSELIIDGQPYFESEEVSPGTIFYDGMLYKEVPMLYDIVKDEVVIHNYFGYPQISLHKEKIDYFSVRNHLFVHLAQDSSEASTIREGFYDRIYQGRSEVLVARSKGILRDASQDAGWIKILKQKNQIYLKKDGQYHSLTAEGSVLKALGSKQKEIQLYLKRSKIKFRKDPEKAVVLMVSYYDQINAKP